MVCIEKCGYQGIFETETDVKAQALLNEWDFEGGQLEARIILWICKDIFLWILWCQQRQCKAHKVTHKLREMESDFNKVITRGLLHESIRSDLLELSMVNQDMYLE